jgi:hypothetical protein
MNGKATIEIITNHLALVVDVRNYSSISTQWIVDDCVADGADAIDKAMGNPATADVGADDLA